MLPLIHGFADELVKLAGVADQESPADVVMAESLGPIPSLVKGYQRGGWKQGLKSGAGYVLGGGAGAAAGMVLAHLIKKYTGHDPGLGPLRMGTVLPALGGVIGGLKGSHLAG